MSKLSTLQMGMVVAVVLAILTVAEYFFAVEIDHDQVRVVGLSVTALLKAWLIMQFFMHLGNVFKPSSEGH